MSTVAVVAHEAKTLGGGLDELRAVLAHAGVDPRLWYEVPKSKLAPARVREALDEGAEIVFVWGGDGMVQRCSDVLAGSGASLAVLPAGTANLLATELDIPDDLEAAVEVGLHGRRRALDVGTLNDERFTVMAGTGFDAWMIEDTSKSFKRRVGKAAYLWNGAKHLREARQCVEVRVDGTDWFEGPASCVLAANVGTVLGGVTAFPDAEPDDGVLELGVVTADGAVEWSRVLMRMVVGRAERSPLARTTAGREIDVRLHHKQPYELDGSDRGKSRHLRIGVEPGALTVCVPTGASR